MSDQLDVSYFKKNLEVILSSITYYTPEEMERTLLTLAAVLTADKPDFDITKHEWCSKYNMDCSVDDKSIHFEDVTESVGSIIMLNKADAIAIAKHFKLTGDDLS